MNDIILSEKDKNAQQTDRAQKNEMDCGDKRNQKAMPTNFTLDNISKLMISTEKILNTTYL